MQTVTKGHFTHVPTLHMTQHDAVHKVHTLSTYPKSSIKPPWVDSRVSELHDTAVSSRKCYTVLSP
jgi:hypothetical protein